MTLRLAPAVCCLAACTATFAACVSAPDPAVAACAGSTLPSAEQAAAVVLACTNGGQAECPPLPFNPNCFVCMQNTCATAFQAWTTACHDKYDACLCGGGATPASCKAELTSDCLAASRTIGDCAVTLCSGDDDNGQPTCSSNLGTANPSLFGTPDGGAAVDSGTQEDAGPAVDAGPFSPESIAGLSEWYEADSLDSTVSDGGIIYSWLGNGGHGGLGQSQGFATTEGPVLMMDAVNGHSAAHFSSQTQDGLKISFGPDEGTVFFVAQPTPQQSGAASQLVFLGGNFPFEWEQDSSGQATEVFGSITGALPAGTASGFHVYMMQYQAAGQGTMGQEWFDSTTLSSGGVSGNPIYTGFGYSSFGTALYSDGSIAEAVLYENELQAPQVSEVVHYLKTKYAIGN